MLTTETLHQFSSGDQLPCTLFSSAPANWCWSGPGALLAPASWNTTPGPGGTHTTATVSVHHRLDRGLFFHRGLVRWTWVMDMNTEGKRGLFSITHRYSTLQGTSTPVAPKGYGVPGSNLPFKALSDQAPHSSAKSPECRWWQCSGCTAHSYSLGGRFTA